MIYRGPSFLAFALFGSTPSPPPSRQQIVSLDQSSCMSVVQLFLRERGGGGGGRGAESYHRKKTWASINRSILAGLTRQLFFDEREGCRGGGGGGGGGHDSNSNFSEDKCQKIYIACPGYCPLYSRL
jgi:hypothetical protein